MRERLSAETAMPGGNGGKSFGVTVACATGFPGNRTGQRMLRRTSTGGLWNGDTAARRPAWRLPEGRGALGSRPEVRLKGHIVYSILGRRDDGRKEG